MTEPAVTIPPADRTLAALTHLSGLSGYAIPFGGVLVPIIIWAVKSEPCPSSVPSKRTRASTIAIRSSAPIPTRRQGHRPIARSNNPITR